MPNTTSSSTQNQGGHKKNSKAKASTKAKSGKEIAAHIDEENSAVNDAKNEEDSETLGR